MAIQPQQKTVSSMFLRPQEQIQAAKKFLREVRAESTKVTWPSKEQTIAGTTVVIFVMVCVAIYLAMCDWMFAHLFKLIGR